MFDVSLLGTGGMMPLPNRFLTSLITRIGGSMLLIDCGEATQITLKSLGWGFKDIDVICFTHYHADHISGLPGMLLAIGNSERTEPLTLIGPPNLVKTVTGLRTICPELPYEIKFIELPYAGTGDSEIRVNDECDGVYLRALPLDHRLICFGYSLHLKRLPKFDIERAKALNIPVNNWNLLQHGKTVVVDGVEYTPDMVMGGARNGIKVCYITDTRPTKKIPEFIKDADLFVCEGIYGDDEKLDKAIDHRHMLFSEAATLAKEGNVKRLWLTHYSPSMPDPQNYIDSARRIFKASYTCKDRTTDTLVFDDM